MKEFILKRKINYYETDRMGVVHHSNYIRFLEEARCAWLDYLTIPFSLLEENGITIPVTFVRGGGGNGHSDFYFYFDTLT